MADKEKLSNKSTKQLSYFGGIGRRKRAVARVKLMRGKGTLTVNQKIWDDLHGIISAPLKVANLNGQFDVVATVNGGGVEAQKEAVRLGISRALLRLDSELRPSLRKAGLLTRDPREKERKKPGLKRARRAPQWSKR